MKIGYAMTAREKNTINLIRHLNGSSEIYLGNSRYYTEIYGKKVSVVRKKSFTFIVKFSKVIIEVF